MATYLQRMEKVIVEWPTPPTTNDYTIYQTPYAAGIVEIIDTIKNVMFHIAAAVLRDENYKKWMIWLYRIGLKGYGVNVQMITASLGEVRHYPSNFVFNEFPYYPIPEREILCARVRAGLLNYVKGNTMLKARWDRKCRDSNLIPQEYDLSDIIDLDYENNFQTYPGSELYPGYTKATYCYHMKCVNLKYNRCIKDTWMEMNVRKELEKAKKAVVKAEKVVQKTKKYLEKISQQNSTKLYNERTEGEILSIDNRNAVNSDYSYRENFQYEEEPDNVSEVGMNLQDPEENGMSM